jgi:hypothetical protein
VLLIMGTYCSHCGRTCACGTGGVVFVQLVHADQTGTAFVADHDPFDRLDNMIRHLRESLQTIVMDVVHLVAIEVPIWRQAFPVWRGLTSPATSRPLPQRPTRAQARTCRRDARRWKRRRFVHALRRQLAKVTAP